MKPSKEEMIPSEWEYVPGCDGLYQANIYGQVRRVYKSKCVLLSGYWKSPKGRLPHKAYHIKKNGRYREYAAIQVIADTFFEGWRQTGKNPYHINGIKDDDRVCNIGFATPKKLGLMFGGNASRMAVMKIAPDGGIVKIYHSARAAGRENHMSYQTVLDRCHNRVKNEYALDGHTYRFIDQGGRQ